MVFFSFISHLVSLTYQPKKFYITFITEVLSLTSLLDVFEAESEFLLLLLWLLLLFLEHGCIGS